MTVSCSLVSAKNVVDGRVVVTENESLISREDWTQITQNGFPKENDVLLTIVGTIGRSAVFTSEEPIAFQRSVAFLRLKSSANPEFMHFCLESLYFQAQLQTVIKSAAQGGVYLGDVVRLFIALPPLDEQCAIAEFLRRRSARLAMLTATKRALIERLKEKRVALISRTITRGLPPDAARAAGLNPCPTLKRTGIDFLGDMPEHWQACRLKFVVLGIEQGWSPECHSHSAAGEEWGVLKAGCCNHGRFDPDENKALPSELEPLSQLEIQAGDVLMSRASGSEELIGSTALVPADSRRRLLLSDKIYRLRPDERSVVPSHLVYLLQCAVGRVQVQQVISGASGLAKNIAQSDVKNFVLTIPPIKEQRAIDDYLGRETGKIDHMVGKVETAIKRLQEYRMALITAAVTGKIDVRGAAA